jgi:hypothetical protein
MIILTACQQIVSFIQEEWTIAYTFSFHGIWVRNFAIDANLEYLYQSVKGGSPIG